MLISVMVVIVIVIVIMILIIESDESRQVSDIHINDEMSNGGGGDKRGR